VSLLHSDMVFLLSNYTRGFDISKKGVKSWCRKKTAFLADQTLGNEGGDTRGLRERTSEEPPSKNGRV